VFSKFLVDEVIILGNIDAIDEIIKTIIVIKKTSYASIFTGYALIIEFGKLIFTKPVSCCRKEIIIPKNKPRNTPLIPIKTPCKINVFFTVFLFTPIE
tara:strand:- start:51 stop:344 length:294 start_codon:yes stop_codon:yes gene_type:complete